MIISVPGSTVSKDGYDANSLTTILGYITILFCKACCFIIKKENAHDCGKIV